MAYPERVSRCDSQLFITLTQSGEFTHGMALIPGTTWNSPQCEVKREGIILEKLPEK